MDSTALRAVQQPLKDAYRDDPQAAVITLEAQGELGEENISCSVATGQALAVAGLHPASGGDGSLACSGDMLLQALVACAGVTPRELVRHRSNASTSTTAWARACGASWGRLCPTPPSISLCSYRPENLPA